ncbi:MAG: bifunctional oligoribonuclease/PAP phosphatase NrnA [Arcobacteraceae bacterium]
MNNSDLMKEAYAAILNAHYILVVTHKNPDADTLSCGLALSNYFSENKIKHKVFNGSLVLPRQLNFLSKFDKITNTIPKFFDLIIYVDAANKERIGTKFPDDVQSICIDHHQSNNHFAHLNIVDDSKGSTAELLYCFFEVNQLSISKKTAECLYTGIYDDSLAFTTPRTDADTFLIISELLKRKIDVSFIAEKLYKRESLGKFKMVVKIMNTLDLFAEGKIATVHLDSIWLKETGAEISECDDIVDRVLGIGIVEVVAYFRVLDGNVRVSLRSKQNIDVSKIASIFQGGGHQNAAGLSLLSDDIEESKKKVVKTIRDYISY